MASKIPLSSFSSCIVCKSSFQPAILIPRTQVAYKWQKKNQNRKNSKLDFATIQLLQDVPKYGPQGAFLQVTRGQMRNEFYPSRQARYIVGDELKQLKLTGIKFERDRGFGVVVEEDAEAERKAELDAVKEEVGQILAEAVAQRQESEERAKEISLHAIARLPQVIQPIYVFYRKVNVQSTEASSTGAVKAGTPIFGSVSASDIIQEIRKSLAADEDTATIPIDESSITFPSLNPETTSQSPAPNTQRRLKELGVFQVDVQIPGSDSIRTSIEIMPDEARPPNENTGDSIVRRYVIQGQTPDNLVQRQLQNVQERPQRLRNTPIRAKE